MNKRKLRRYLVRLRSVPHWGLLAVTLFLGIVAIFSLRANNLEMLRLREAVFAADEENGDIEGALADLREHVYSHMNTSLTAGDNAIRPPIQLQHEYERLKAAAEEASEVSNDKIYTDAQSYCEQLISTGFSGRGRIQCIEDYVDRHGNDQTDGATVPEGAYKFDFASPTWSPDLAGWSIVGFFVFGVLFLIRLASELLIRRQLSRHN